MTGFDAEALAKSAPRLIALGFKVLAPRVLTFSTMLITAALFGVAIYDQTWISLAVAGAFGVLVFLPVLSKDKHPEG